MAPDFIPTPNEVPHGLTRFFEGESLRATPVRRLLLDTPVALRAVSNPERLGDRARHRIEDPRNRVYGSAASLGEIVVEGAVGKLEAPPLFIDRRRFEGYRELRITFAHAEQTSRVPPIHRHPSDRMLVAQNSAEGLTLVTADARIRRYDVATMNV